MAIYVWKCEVCDNEQEVERPVSESNIPPNQCDKCLQSDHNLYINRKPNWTKLIKSTSFILGGGGWYKDGYQKEKK